MPRIPRKAHASVFVAVVLVLLTAALTVHQAGAPGLLALAALLRATTQLIEAFADH
jgi:hypothetical protein